jgi:hypothetical protein
LSPKTLVGKITIDLDDSVERRLRGYIGSTYPKPHGKIKEVMEKAITDYCSTASLTQFVGSLDLGEHVLLVGEDVESARRVELEFVAKSVDKGYNTVVLGQDHPARSVQTIVEEARSAGVELGRGAASRLLSVVAIPEHSDYTELATIHTFGPLMKLEPPVAVLISGSMGGTEEGFERRLALDARLHEAFDIRMTMLCTYPALLDPNQSSALGRLMQMHTSAIFALINRNSVLGPHDAADNAKASTGSNGSAAGQTYHRGDRTA